MVLLTSCELWQIKSQSYLYCITLQSPLIIVHGIIINMFAFNEPCGIWHFHLLMVVISLPPLFSRAVA